MGASLSLRILGPWYMRVLYIFQPLQRLAIHLVARVLNYFFVVFANKHGLHKIRHLSPIGSSSWHQKSKRYSNQYLQTIASYYYTYNSNLNYLLMQDTQLMKETNFLNKISMTTQESSKAT